MALTAIISRALPPVLDHPNPVAPALAMLMDTLAGIFGVSAGIRRQRLKTAFACRTRRTALLKNLNLDLRLDQLS